MSFLDNLEWRNATKLFDDQKTVSDNDLETLKNAIKMTPTSFGLEPFHVKIITDQGLKDQIQAFSWNQPQVGTCSHLLVFCYRKDYQSRIEDYFEIASGGNAEVKEKMSGYRDMMEGFLGNTSPEGIETWAKKQAYLALGFAMAACAEMKVDSCPMEGCDFKKLDELLSMPDHMNSVVMLPIGYRADEPSHGKVRYPESDLFS